MSECLLVSWPTKSILRTTASTCLVLSRSLRCCDAGPRIQLSLMRFDIQRCSPCRYTSVLSTPLHSTMPDVISGCAFVLCISRPPCKQFQRQSSGLRCTHQVLTSSDPPHLPPLDPQPIPINVRNPPPSHPPRPLGRTLESPSPRIAPMMILH